VQRTVARWQLDEGAGQAAYDATGNGNEMVLGTSGALEPADPAWTSALGEVCATTALDFSAITSQATVAPSPTLNARSVFSISFCIFPRSGGGSGYGRILSKETLVGFDDLYVHLSGSSLGAVVFTTDGTEIDALSAEGTLPYNQRTCWAITYDDEGDRRAHIFAGGVEVAYAVQGIVGGALRTTSAPWRIGNRAANDRNFDGVIDELAIDNYVISESEIAARSTLCAPSL
jgi:hypothetical protein